MSDLTPYERWMVKSNLQTARETGVTPAEQATLVRANGYARVADAIAATSGTDDESEAQG